MSVPPKCRRAGREGLVGALQNALGTDVDPTAGGHLAVHGQAEGFESAEFVPGGPFGHEHRVADEHAGRVGVCLEYADGPPGLHQHGLVIFEPLERGDDAVEILPRPGRLPGPAVDYEVFGIFGNVGIEVVHEHAQGGFLLPALAGELDSMGGTDGTRRRGRRRHSSLLRGPNRVDYYNTSRAAVWEAVYAACGGANGVDDQVEQHEATGLR